MELFETWGRTEWVLLVVNAIAVYIVVRFSIPSGTQTQGSGSPQAHERLMRKRDRTHEETDD